jgi:hypothetical protein
MAQQSLVGQGLLIKKVLQPNSVELLCTNDQPEAEASTWQHTTFTRDIHAPGRIQTCYPSKRADADTRLSLRGQGDRSKVTYSSTIIVILVKFKILS